MVRIYLPVLVIVVIGGGVGIIAGVVRFPLAIDARRRSGNVSPTTSEASAVKHLSLHAIDAREPRFRRALEAATGLTPNKALAGRGLREIRAVEPECGKGESLHRTEAADWRAKWTRSWQSGLTLGQGLRGMGRGEAFLFCRAVVASRRPIWPHSSKPAEPAVRQLSRSERGAGAICAT